MLVTDPVPILHSLKKKYILVNQRFQIPFELTILTFLPVC
jgi:hypothetical protein